LFWIEDGFRGQVVDFRVDLEFDDLGVFGVVGHLFFDHDHVWPALLGLRCVGRFGPIVGVVVSGSVCVTGRRFLVGPATTPGDRPRQLLFVLVRQSTNY
jgi:hypothetical protein